MPEVKNRNRREQQVRAALSKCRDSQKKELLRLLGTPPDFGNVPDEFWERAEECERDSLLPLLGFLYLAGSRNVQREVGLRPDEDALRSEAADYAAKRAERLAKSAVKNSRKALRSKLATKTKREGFDGADLEPIFGRPRIEALGQTEVTKANGDGERGGIKDAERQGVVLTAIWRLEPNCNHCIFCPCVANTPASFYQKILPAPPAHPRCCCHIEIFRGTEEEARKRNLIRRSNPSAAQCLTRFAAIGGGSL